MITVVCLDQNGVVTSSLILDPAEQGVGIAHAGGNGVLTLDYRAGDFGKSPAVGDSFDGLRFATGTIQTGGTLA